MLSHEIVGHVILKDLLIYTYDTLIAKTKYVYIYSSEYTYQSSAVEILLTSIKF